MSNTTTKFWVERNTHLLHGTEKYFDDVTYEWDFADYNGPTEFDTEAEAIEFMHSQRDNLQAPEVTHTPYGLDSVEYEAIEVIKVTFDDDGDHEEYETIDSVSSLTDDDRKRIDAHKREYWDYLDFESDTYGSLELEER